MQTNIERQNVDRQLPGNGEGVRVTQGQWILLRLMDMTVMMFLQVCVYISQIVYLNIYSSVQFSCSVMSDSL